MKIELDLPEWTEERAIYIMAGVELAAYKVPFKKWKVKVGRCNMCGKCCMDLKNHAFPTIDGKCIHLKKRPGNNPEWECAFRISRPFGCCVGVSERIKECTEKYEEI